MTLETPNDKELASWLWALANFLEMEEDHKRAIYNLYPSSADYSPEMETLIDRLRAHGQTLWER